jgi:hypothetical protein
VDDLAIAELHNTHRVYQSPLVRDCVFRDPEISASENPLDLEAGRLAGMMTPQSLQIASPEDSLARLGIITNGIVIVNIVFRVCIADCRRVPVRIQGRTDLFLSHGLPPSYFTSGITAHYPLFLSLTTQAGAPFLLRSKGQDINALFSRILFSRAPLHCVPASQNRDYWEQLRASLRRKEKSFGDFDGTSETRTLTLVSRTEAREE